MRGPLPRGHARPPHHDALPLRSRAPRVRRAPGRALAKRRHRAASGGLDWGVDVFEGALAGLVLAEREFASEAELLAAAAPAFGALEVTDDRTFSGGALATAEPGAVLARAAALLARLR